ncbi:6981_t:CDS:2 [Funneliformis caledonium]|uniref:6981_t:CDS:1 n=1 Tax=Funneliformis caledonium TaxID=1117310 RepID=A0A9N9DBE9_9GLOM|nr:6981_t:CDS:2 [Funneliformis caledonium]
MRFMTISNLLKLVPIAEYVDNITYYSFNGIQLDRFLGSNIVISFMKDKQTVQNPNKEDNSEEEKDEKYDQDFNHDDLNYDLKTLRATGYPGSLSMQIIIRKSKFPQRIENIYVSVELPYRANK